MNFAQLPLDGGIYGQHPSLLDAWSVIWELKGQDQAIKEAREKRKKPKTRGPAKP
jgi:hypothetical protein